jgi:pantetheine-phosphate adenylyltransferase
LPNVEVASFHGLLSTFAAEAGADAIVRGLRATADFEYEFQMAMVNRKMQPQIETVFFMTNWEHSYVSSSIVKEVAMLHGDFHSLVPPAVAPLIEQAVRDRAHKPSSG